MRSSSSWSEANLFQRGARDSDDEDESFPLGQWYSGRAGLTVNGSSSIGPSSREGGTCGVSARVSGPSGDFAMPSAGSSLVPVAGRLPRSVASGRSGSYGESLSLDTPLGVVVSQLSALGEVGLDGCPALRAAALVFGSPAATTAGAPAVPTAGGNSCCGAESCALLPPAEVL